ncbi:integrase [Candidatus Shapirobacteria bacterium]|nr:integrase [Candidatus Shapirobacteria bacterium]
MKPFESSLADWLEKYVSYRCGLGYSQKNLRICLRAFDRCLSDQKADLAHLDASFFLELKKSFHQKPSRFNAIALAVRGFFSYLVRLEIVSENPLANIESYPKKTFMPFIFSPCQIDELLCAAQKSIRKTCPDLFYKDFAAYMAIMLLSRCGMRLKEPLRLKCLDYNKHQALIYIEKTKFSKNRLIPVPKAAAKEIENYMNVRNAFIADDNQFFFAGENKRPLSDKNIYRLFDQSIKNVGIQSQKSSFANMTFGRPTPHSLRHSFAVNTLAAVKQRGRSPQNALPVLSAYLGHCKYRYTAVYLKVLDAKHRQTIVDFAIGRQEKL